MKNMSAKDAQNILDCVREAKEKIPRLDVGYVENMLNERIVFANTTLKRLENAKFWNVVKNDLEYYRQKERLRLQKEKAQAQSA